MLCVDMEHGSKGLDTDEKDSFFLICNKKNAIILCNNFIAK